MYFFHKKHYQMLFIFDQFNKLFSSKPPNFTPELAIYFREKTFVIRDNLKTMYI